VVSSWNQSNESARGKGIVSISPDLSVLRWFDVWGVPKIG
jgi:hypothetical protein